MSQLSKTSFSNLYGTSGTTFPDNTTGDISEGDMRTFGDDLLDSALFIEDNAYSSFVVTASGTDTYTATLSPAITSYTTGAIYRILFTNANTGAATLNLNAIAAKAIKKNGSSALAAGDIPAASYQELMYDGTNLQLLGHISVNAGTTITASTYSPTLTSVANLDSVTGATSQYIRVGSVVTVSGVATVNATSATTTTRFRISLPVSSNFAALEQCGGSAAAAYNETGLIIADATNNEAEVYYVSGTDTGSHVMSYTFTYLIV